jgi:glycosyltransferase involved in cell wall biosynthesis
MSGAGVDPPLVTIGIPTYNRAKLLPRAVESALAQDYGPIDIVISDNASTDGTAEVCRELAARDERIRCMRHASNCGASANFRAVLQAARGELFMWLGDDDWIDHHYVSRCAAVLLADPAYSLVCGGDVYRAEGKPDRRGESLSLTQEAGASRLISYYRQVGMNGAFYGLMRRSLIQRIPIDHALGGDWLMVAAMAYLGKIKALEDVFLYRSTEGVSQSWESLAAAYGLEGFSRAHPVFAIARTIFADIVWKSPIYSSLDTPRRIEMASRAAYAVVRSRYSLRQALGIVRQLVSGGWGAR